MHYGMAQYKKILIGLNKNGFSILNECYSKNEVRKIGKVLQDYFDQFDEPTFGKLLCASTSMQQQLKMVL